MLVVIEHIASCHIVLQSESVIYLPVLLILYSYLLCLDCVVVGRCQFFLAKTVYKAGEYAGGTRYLLKH